MMRPTTGSTGSPPVGPPLVPVASGPPPVALDLSGGYSVSRGTSLLVEAQAARTSDAAQVAALLRWCRAGALLTRLSATGGASEERLRFFQARRQRARHNWRNDCLTLAPARNGTQLTADGTALAWGSPESGSRLNRQLAFTEVCVGGRRSQLRTPR
jgi:hypothetical protein